MPLFKRQTPVALPPDTNGPWSVAQATHDGRVLFVRLNRGLTSIVGDKRFPWRAGIAVRLHDPNEHGLPVSSRDTDALARFEDELAATLTTPSDTFFALVLTSAGVREFVWYTADDEAFRQRFRSWAKTPKSHPVQMSLTRDPAWSIFRQLESLSPSA